MTHADAMRRRKGRKMTELKPCPFCGSKAVKIVYWDEEEQNEKVWEHGIKQDENHYYVIRCYDCDIELFGGVPISGEELIKAWNRRTENE
jgi:Lar family restriction alleviation protein